MSARATIVASLAATCIVAVAQPLTPQTMYSCVANGRTYTGDRPPPECANSDVRELNRDGSLRRVIERPLTPEEQRARALEAKKKAEENDRILAQRRRDRSLLETYASEDEIEAARQKALDSSREVLRRSEARIERMDADRKRLDDETEFYKKRDVPDKVQRAYVNNEQEKTAELKIVKDARAEMQRINERFDADKKRFRELLTQGATPAQRTSPAVAIPAAASAASDPRSRGR